MRIVLDTNQLVSALIRKNGRPAQILQAWRQGQVELAVSPDLLEEVAEVLNRPRIKHKYRLTDEDIDQYLLLLKWYAITTPGTTEVSIVAADPDDNIIVACAVEAEADYIVSGDSHLLDLEEYQGIQIVQTSDFLQILEAEDTFRD